MVENRQRRIDSTGGWQVLVAQPKKKTNRWLACKGYILEI